MRDIFSLKTLVLRRCLPLRADLPEVLSAGDYLPLERAGRLGRHVVAFGRSAGGRAVIAVAPRLCLGLAPSREPPFVRPDAWEDTVVLLPSGLRNRAAKEVISGCSHKLGERVALKELLTSAPLAALRIA